MLNQKALVQINTLLQVPLPHAETKTCKRVFIFPPQIKLKNKNLHRTKK